MEVLKFNFQGTKTIKRKAQVGVVSSGNLEVLMEPADDKKSNVIITTKFDGNKNIWGKILKRFFEEHKCLVNIEINDFGATPGVISLRLLQCLEVCNNDL